MRWFREWRERYEQADQERWERIHRWDALMAYNGERSRGIAHTPEYDAAMAAEQAAFEADMRARYGRWNRLDVTNQ